MNVVMAHLKEEDLEVVMDWRMGPYITEYMYTYPQLTMETQRAWYNLVKDRDDRIIWIINYEGKPIGLINVFDIDRVNSRCSWGYYIAEREFRSLKLALYLEWSLYDYVFDVLKLHKLCNETFMENAEVIKRKLSNCILCVAAKKME